MLYNDDPYKNACYITTILIKMRVTVLADNIYGLYELREIFWQIINLILRLRTRSKPGINFECEFRTIFSKFSQTFWCSQERQWKKTGTFWCSKERQWKKTSILQSWFLRKVGKSQSKRDKWGTENKSF